MKTRSLRRQLVSWVLGTLFVCIPLLAVAAYLLMLAEVNEVLDDSLREAALLLADRDLRGALAPSALSAPTTPFTDTESQLVAIGRSKEGERLFDSRPELGLRFEAIAGSSVQHVLGADWHVFTVVQADRVVQVAQTLAARRNAAAESASQLLLPLAGMALVAGVLLILALRRGLRPLKVAERALAERGARSLQPLGLEELPTEMLPIVRSVNDLMRRLAASFETQRHFIADAAHELRSPVTALQLQVQILEASADPAGRALATAELASGIGRTRRLIEQLLSESRIASDDNADGGAGFSAVDLAAVVRAVVERRADEADRRGIDLEASLGGDALVCGNAEQLDMLVSNLIENALRYTRAGGTVDASVGSGSGVVVLCVTDNGPGIPEDERARVFDRFYRSPRAVAGGEFGSGLGLSIVRSIADRHGAAATLGAGRDGTGLEVRIVWPAAGLEP